MEIDKIIEFADNILKNSDISQKRNGLTNLAKKLQSDFPDAIPFINSEIKQFPQWRYADYKDEIYMGYIGDTKKKMLMYVNEHFSDITQYEADNEADLEIRKKKLQEYAQVVSISPSVKRVIKHMGVRNDTEVEYEYSPDRIYVQNGIYRMYWNYKNNPYFIFALCLRKQFGNYNFLDLSKKVFLYISLKNELKQIEEEMELLGIEFQKKEENNCNVKASHFIKESELKDCFTLAFKGGGNSTTRIDYFTEYLLPDLKIERKAKDFARIALLIYDSKVLLPAKRPNTFDSWYRTFCELVGCEYNSNYKRSKLDIDENFKQKFNYL